MTVDSAAIYSLFETAVANKLKYPKIRLRASNGVTVVLRRNGDKSKYPGTIAVTDDRPYGFNSYFGRIETNGSFVNGRDADVFIGDLLAKLAANPAEVASEYGKLTGSCCFCEKSLTDARSSAVGYGPVCADKFGLPWGSDFKAPKDISNLGNSVEAEQANLVDALREEYEAKITDGVEALIGARPCGGN